MRIVKHFHQFQLFKYHFEVYTWAIIVYVQKQKIIETVFWIKTQTSIYSLWNVKQLHQLPVI
jgi:hypothetical protein